MYTSLLTGGVPALTKWNTHELSYTTGDICPYPKVLMGRDGRDGMRDGAFFILCISSLFSYSVGTASSFRFSPTLSHHLYHTFKLLFVFFTALEALPS